VRCSCGGTNRDCRSIGNRSMAHFDGSPIFASSLISMSGLCVAASSLRKIDWMFMMMVRPASPGGMGCRRP
jgi:hypothetical protein